MHAVKYRHLTGSHGIAIDLLVRCVHAAHPKGSIEITPYLWLSVPEWFSGEERNYTLKGILPFVPQFEARGKHQVIYVIEARWNPCDYDPKGLEAAMKMYCEKEFAEKVEKSEPLAVPAVMSKEANSYTFEEWNLIIGFPLGCFLFLSTVGAAIGRYFGEPWESGLCLTGGVAGVIIGLFLGFWDVSDSRRRNKS